MALDDLFAGLAGGFGGLDTAAQNDVKQRNVEADRAQAERMAKAREAVEEMIARIAASSNESIAAGHDTTAVKTTGMETGSAESIAAGGNASRERISAADNSTQRYGIDTNERLGKFVAGSNAAASRYGADKGVESSLIGERGAWNRSVLGQQQQEAEFARSLPAKIYETEVGANKLGAGERLTGADKAPTFGDWSSTFKMPPTGTGGPAEPQFQYADPSGRPAGPPAPTPGPNAKRQTPQQELAAIIASPKPSDPKLLKAQNDRIRQLLTQMPQ